MMMGKSTGLDGKVHAVNSRWNKKGQVTVFIIIGILILALFAAVLYFTKLSVKETVTAEGEPVIAEVPQEFQPLQSYVEDCLGQTAQRGLLVLGEQGGYIYPDLVGEYSADNPTDADGLKLGGSLVLFWHYNSQPNTEKVIAISSLQPKLTAAEDPQMSIESQLSRYVRENVDKCLGDFTPFKTQSIEVVKEDTNEVTVTIGSSGVGFLLKTSLKAKRGEASTEMNDFYTSVPLKLKSYYEIADKIASAERDYRFLERQGMELISAYSRLDPEFFAPTSDVTFDLYSPLVWNEKDLAGKYNELLNSYIPMLRYLGSENYYDTLYPDGYLLAQKVADNMVLPLSGAENLEVSFDHFDWKPYFKTNSKDGMIQPESLFVNYKVLTFGQQRYETHYDISYPVLISLRDNDALKGRGYNFVFALESNIRNNVPAEGGKRVTSPPPVTNMACEEKHQNSEVLKTVVVDSFTKEPLELVRIGFTIPEIAQCEMGFTDGEGTLEKRYPLAYGGMVDLVRTDYLSNFYPINTYEYKDDPEKEEALIGYAAAGNGQQRVIEMHRLKTINIGLMKKELRKCVGGKCPGQGILSAGSPLYSYTPQMIKEEQSWTFGGGTRELEDTEEAVITLNRVSDINPSVFSDEFMATAALSGNEEVQTELVPGVYEVSIMLTNKKPLLVPKSERCTGGIVESLACWDAKGCCFTFDEVKMDSYMSGQLQWGEKNYLTITPEDLYTSEKITFYVPTADLGKVPENQRLLEDLQAVSQLGNISTFSGVRESLKPQFS